MPRKVRIRMARYAAFSVVHGLVLLAAITGLLGGQRAAVVLLASLPLFPAWGAFQADIAVNPALDDTARSRWRVAMWVVPWSMAAYWQLQVRPREVF